METNQIELDLMNIIMKIPKDSIELEINAKVLQNNIIQKVTTKMSVSEIFEMRKDFLDNLDDDYDAVYYINPMYPEGEDDDGDKTNNRGAEQ